MRRGKPPQPIYRPGSGPLKKSNTIDESESDSNIFINSREKQVENPPIDNSKFRSEGSSPREKLGDIDRATSQLGDLSLNNDVTRRQKKPDQERYVPRPLAQARELNTSQDMNRNTFSHINGTDKSSDRSDRVGHKRTPFSERHQADKNDWREEAARPRQQVDNRGMNNGPTNSNWNRSRDTRSVEPSGPTNRNYNAEKIQSKPPSGRRHSTVGVEMEKRYTYSIPPRFQKKLLEESRVQQPPLAEENVWDGSSVTFQKNANFSHAGGAYYTLPMSPASHHNVHYGSNTLPGKGRGRGRFNYDQDMQSHIGGSYDSSTPDRIRSPANSRPCSPPIGRSPQSRPQTPINEYPDNRRGPRRHEDRRENNHKRDFIPRRDGKNYNWGDNYNNRDNYGHRDNHSNKEHYNQRWEDDNRGSHNKDRNREVQNRENYNREGYNRDSHNRDGYNRENYNRDGHNRDGYNRREGRDRRGGGGGGNRDRRRDNNRRERDKRSRSKESFQPPASVISEENWDDELSQSSMKSSQETLNQEKLEFRLGVESAVNFVMPATLDWSEEVELQDRLESEYLSDALTRSSSIVSLQEIGATKSLPCNVNDSSKKNRRRNRRRSRNRSRQRDDDSNSITRNRKNSTTSIDSRDSFKTPNDSYPSSSRISSQDTSSYDRYNTSSNVSRDSSWDRHTQGAENWRVEIQRKRNENEKETNVNDIQNVDANTKKAGVLVLPQQNNEAKTTVPTLSTQDHPRYPDNRRNAGQQKILYDPNNPSKPIIVKSSSTRVSVPGFSDNAESTPPQMYTTDQFGNLRPPWYDETTDSFKSCHFPVLLKEIKMADNELQYVINRGLLLVQWDQVDQLRGFLKDALKFLICKAIKFCQTENVEQHFWNILYHNIIEVTRKAIKNDPENKEKYKGFLIYLIDEGNKYYERLLSVLEKTFEFKLNNYLRENNMVSHKGLGLVGMALISSQKLFMFLGDLGRYREDVNETSNYGKCRQ